MTTNITVPQIYLNVIPCGQMTLGYTRRIVESMATLVDAAYTIP